MTIVSLPLSIERGRVPRSIPECPTLSSPGTAQQTVVLTDARIKQTEQHKADEEAGIKPRKIPQLVEEGNDDCGDDLKGLGCSAYYTDVPLTPTRKVTMKREPPRAGLA
eukprot:6030064-Pyramimonas_sp.AAC.1